MILSLNDAYTHDTLHYMCNALGEINADMTAEEAELYQNLWGSICHDPTYVLRILKPDEPLRQAAIGLCYRFPDGWAEEALMQEHIPNAEEMIQNRSWEDPLFLAMGKAVQECCNFAPVECDVYLGKNTDPEGHEILVVIPYPLRDRVHDLTGYFELVLSQTVRNRFVEEILRGRLDEKVRRAEQVLIENGIEPDEAPTVLQAIGYVLLDEELYPEEA